MQMGRVWTMTQSLLNYLHRLVQLRCSHINGTKLSVDRNFVGICFKCTLIVWYCFVVFLLPAICKPKVYHDAVIVWINFGHSFEMFYSLVIMFICHSNTCQVSFNLCFLVSIAGVG